MHHKLLLLAAVAAAAALLVPVGFAGTPNGKGLYREHESTCTYESGAPFYEGTVTLVPGAGNSFWVHGYHLVIQSATIIPESGSPVDYTFGVKAGKASAGNKVTCEGDFPGYHVVSHDVIVP